MPATHPRAVAVRTAERPRSSYRPSEDRVLIAAHAVAVLDGASQPERTELDGGWLAQQLGDELRHRLPDHDYGLAEILADSIAAVASRHRLTPGASPSTTASIVRWDADTVDVLVLGDSPVIARTRKGQIRQLRDGRLHRVARRQRQRIHNVHGDLCSDEALWRELVAAERAQRNQPDGYWIAEADPEAAAHAVRARWPIGELSTVLAMTDGVAVGVDRYGVPAGWSAAMDIAEVDPDRLVDLVHRTEVSDPDGVMWQRTKRHDDKAIAVIQFGYT